MITPNHLSTPLHILVGEDEPEIRDYLQLALRRPDSSLISQKTEKRY